MMSDTKAFRFKGTEEEWNFFTSELKKKGKAIETEFNQFVRRKIDEAKGMEKDDSKTASRYQDELQARIMDTDLSSVIRDGFYHVNLDGDYKEFIQTAKHELYDRIRNAVKNAIYQNWIRKWSKLRGIDEKQAEVYYAMHDGATKFYKYLDKINITFSCDSLPVKTLSDLVEQDLGKVVQFDATIIGSEPKKLDIITNRYIQKVLLQEPEEQSKQNNPMVLKSVFHGTDTEHVATGQKKRIIGIYSLEEPTNGKADIPEKKLLMDVVFARDMEKSQSFVLSKKEIDVAREMAKAEPEQYLNQLLDSFCPKIYGRNLEKQALYLSLLGGSDIDNYRKESHIMLIGEADSGKSELVKFADNVADVSSIVDGSNATGVGILFALDDYDGSKILRSGAMILNNGGHIIVDEYDKMPKQEQKKFNQAMEQQRATYNKGGHIGNAECKTTVITACNPKNERWVAGDIVDNMPFDPSTITRFDLIIRTQKETHENEIRAKMKHIMKGKRGELEQVADPKYIKGLLNYLRRQKPLITSEAEELLINKFVEFTQIEQSDDALPIQTRQMEGIQRLCEAYAKLMFRPEVDCDIVEEVIEFYQKCLASLGMNVSKGVAQFDLSGKAINKDKFFEDTFKDLASESDDGYVLLHELGEALMESDKFGTTHVVEAYIEKRVKSGWLFEPKPGVFKKQ
jgi:DNA replicative helicase MCM subunit Mcm2 (Cdc46/Mcm family)